MWGCALLNKYSQEIRTSKPGDTLAGFEGVRAERSAGRPAFVAPVRIAGRKAVVSASTSTPGRFRHLTGDMWGDTTSTWTVSPQGEVRRESANLASPAALPSVVVSAMLADMDAIASAVAARAASDAAELAKLGEVAQAAEAAYAAEIRKWDAECGPSGHGGRKEARESLLRERAPVERAHYDARHRLSDKRLYDTQDDAVVTAWAVWAASRREHLLAKPAS